VLAANLDGLKDVVMNNQTGYLLTAEKPEIWIDKIIEISWRTISQRLGFIRSSMKMPLSVNVLIIHPLLVCAAYSSIHELLRAS